jgi:hypothetical protein
MKTLMEITKKVNEKTGLEGAELEALVLFGAMMMADTVGSKTGDYFEQRMREAWERR